MTNEIAVQTQQSQNLGFMTVTTFEDAMRCSEVIAKSSFCPKAMAGKPGDVLVALQMGLELGLKPMQALQNIAVINGRPSIWGDAMLAVCRQAPDFEFIEERFDDASMTATCKVKRQNEPEVIQTFSIADAKLAGLAGKDGPWRTYPKRMLQMRARGFALRDAFPDTLRGIIIREEAQDMPTRRNDFSKSTGNTIDAEVVVPEVISSWQLDELTDSMVHSSTKPDDICTHLKIKALEEMTTQQFDEVMRLLNRKLAKQQKSESLEINKVFDEREKEKEKVD